MSRVGIMTVLLIGLVSCVPGWGDDKRVAVVGLATYSRNAEQDAWVGVSLGSALATRLSAGKTGLQKVERIEIAQVLRLRGALPVQLDYQDPAQLEKAIQAIRTQEIEDTRNSKSQAPDSGMKLLGATHLIVGSVELPDGSGVGKPFSLSVRIVDMATGDVGDTGVTCAGKVTSDGLQRAAVSLACEVCRGMGGKVTAEMKKMETVPTALEQALAEAQRLLYEGRYDDALKVAEAGRQDASGDVVSKLLLAEVDAHRWRVVEARRQEKPEDVINGQQRWYEAARAAVGQTGKPHAVAHFSLAEASRDMEKYAEAIQNYQEAIKEGKDDADTWLGLAYSLWHTHDLEGATTAYTRAIEHEPDCAFFYAFRGLMLELRGQGALGVSDIGEAIRLQPSNADWVLMRGHAYATIGKFAEALSDYNEAAKLAPRTAYVFRTRGILHFNMCSYDLAISDFSRAIELDPTDAYAYERRGGARLKLRDFPHAIADFSKAIDLEPDSLTYCRRAQARVEGGDPQAALADFDGAIRLDSRYQEAYFCRGCVLMQLEQWDKAISDFSMGIQLQPDAMAYAWRCLAYLKTRHYDNALADFDKAEELDPKALSMAAYMILNIESPYRSVLSVEALAVQKLAALDPTIKRLPNLARVYQGMGNACDELGQYDQALADYTKAIELQPDSAEIYTERGVVYFELKQYDQALADWTKAIEFKPGYAWAYVLRGSLYMVLKQCDQALADCTKATELQPGLAVAYSNRAGVYATLEQHDKAIADYTTVIELKPDYAAYTSRGDTYFRLRQYDKALADYEKAIELEPNSAAAYFSRAIIYCQLQQFDHALVDCTKAIELKPDSVDMHFVRGDIHYWLKQYEQALADWTTAVELKPDFAEAYAHRGRVYVQLKQYPQATADFKRASDLKPELIDTWVGLTWSLYLVGRLEEAAAAAREGLKRFPDSEYLTGNLAIALLTSGKDEEAVAQYRRLVQIGAQRALDGGCGKDLSDLVVKRPELGLAHFCIGLLYDGAGQKAEAITEYQAYLKAQPQGKYAAESRARLEALQP
ncbi:MAG: tetratricopeptide repeat protein [Armatimonadia bacterium]